MKIRLFLMLIILFAQSAFANHEPKVCPSAAAIKAGGINTAISTPFDWTVANSKNNYGTPEEWTFILNFVTASSKEEALIKGNADLKFLLSGNEPPMLDDENNRWVCFYAREGDQELSGSAVYPAMSLADLEAFVHG